MPRFTYVHYDGSDEKIIELVSKLAGHIKRVGGDYHRARLERAIQGYNKLRAVGQQHHHSLPALDAKRLKPSGETVDLLGKNDRVVATGPHRGDFVPGHTKWDYAHSIGDLRPDLVVQLWRPTLAEGAALGCEEDAPLACDGAAPAWAPSARASARPVPIASNRVLRHNMNGT